MPQYVVVTFKEVSYRGSVEGWTNRYVYRGPGMSEESANGILDEVLENERAFHGKAVRFTRATISTPRDTPPAEKFYFQRTINDPLPTAGVTMDPERAFLLQAPAGLSTTNKPVYLRKWYHVCDNDIGASIINQSAITQQARLIDVVRNEVEVAVNNLIEVGPGAFGDIFSLEADSGREPTGPFVCYPWLEHHELGDQWRA